MEEQVYKVVLHLPLLARASSAADLRCILSEMTIEQVVGELEEGIDMIGGTRSIGSIEHIPTSEIEKELLAVGNDGTFFEDMHIGGDHDEAEGKDQD